MVSYLLAQFPAADLPPSEVSMALPFPADVEQLITEAGVEWIKDLEGLDHPDLSCNHFKWKFKEVRETYGFNSISVKNVKF